MPPSSQLNMSKIAWQAALADRVMRITDTAGRPIDAFRYKRRVRATAAVRHR